jgi:hypothetical protein
MNALTTIVMKATNNVIETTARLLNFLPVPILLIFNGCKRFKRTGFYAFQTSCTFIGMRKHGMFDEPGINFPDYLRRTCVKAFPASHALERIEPDKRFSHFIPFLKLRHKGIAVPVGGQ